MYFVRDSAARSHVLDHGPKSHSNIVPAGSNGTVCVNNLPFGNYSIAETATPNGYAIDNSLAVAAMAGTTGACSATPSVSETFTDTPLTDLTVAAKSEASGGTKSTITCTDSLNVNIGNSSQGSADPTNVTAHGLKPGTYTRTVVIDL